MQSAKNVIMKNKTVTIIVLSILVLVLGGFLYKTVGEMKNNKQETNKDMREVVLKSLKERRSIRVYKDLQVSDADLNAVLEAATYAPSGMNRQHALMVVVQDPDTIMKLAKLNASIMGNVDENNFKNPFYGAPTVVVVFGDSNVGTYVEDGSLVMGNLMNAAHAVGLGSCWIHRAREVFQTEEGKAMMKRWGIPESYIGIGNCILGYPDGDYPQARPRKADYIRRVD